MLYKRFIEVGRIVIVNFGPSKGKIGVIVDVIDQNRCIIDGWTGRQVANVKRFALTKLKLKVNSKASSQKIKNKLVSEFQTLSIWQKSLWAQKNFIKEKKKKFNNFENFKYMIGKKHKNLFNKS